MGFRDDERGQSVQIGAVLLFGVLVIAFASYQAVVVPDQNRAVEFNHNQDVQGELQDLRNAVVSMPGGVSTKSTSVTLGAQYPARVVALNPPAPVGRLRTLGTTNPAVNVSIRNVESVGETRDFWNGDPRNYSTGAITYAPGYNVYADAPTTTYEHSVLTNQFRSDRLRLTDQTVVDGNRISLVVLNGSFDRSSSGGTSVDARPVSSSTRTIDVSRANSSQPITVTLPSRLSVSEWNDLLSDHENVTAVGGAEPVPGEFESVTLKLTEEDEYRLQLTKVGVGSGVTAEDAAYLTVIDAPSSLQAGSNGEVTFEVRDRFNNPISGVTVDASVGGTSKRGVSDGDGQVTFGFETTDSTDDEYWANATLNGSDAVGGSSFDAGHPRNASVGVTVTQGGSGSGTTSPYTLSWKSPDEISDNDADALSSCSAESCTWDVGKDDDNRLDLNATTTLAIEGLDVDFAVDDTEVADTREAATDSGSAGDATTQLVPVAAGTVTVYAASGPAATEIEIDVQNVSTGGGGGGGGDAIAYPDAYRDENGGDSSIPPSNPVGTIQGFDRLSTDDDSDAVFAESATTGSGSNPKYRHRTGLRVGNVAAGDHTLSTEYLMQQGANSESYTVTVVDAFGTEIDAGTDYALSATGTRTTASFALSQAESDYVDANGDVYLRVTDPGEDSTNDQLYVDYVRVDAA